MMNGQPLAAPVTGGLPPGTATSEAQQSAIGKPTVALGADTHPSVFYFTHFFLRGEETLSPFPLNLYTYTHVYFIHTFH